MGPEVSDGMDFVQWEKDLYLLGDISLRYAKSARDLGDTAKCFDEAERMLSPYRKDFELFKQRKNLRNTVTTALKAKGIWEKLNLRLQFMSREPWGINSIDMQCKLDYTQAIVDYKKTLDKIERLHPDDDIMKVKCSNAQECGFTPKWILKEDNVISDRHMLKPA